MTTLSGGQQKQKCSSTSMLLCGDQLSKFRSQEQSSSFTGLDFHNLRELHLMRNAECIWWWVSMHRNFKIIQKHKWQAISTVNHKDIEILKIIFILSKFEVACDDHFDSNSEFPSKSISNISKFGHSRLPIRNNFRKVRKFNYMKFGLFLKYPAIFNEVHRELFEFGP